MSNIVLPIGVVIPDPNQSGMVAKGVTVLPTASIAEHRKILVLESTIGTIDRVYICIRTAIGVYEWKQITLM